MAGGSSYDSTLEDSTLFASALSEPNPTTGSPGGFTLTIASTKTDYVGSRVVRYQTKLGNSFNKNFFIRFNIVPDDRTIKNPADQGVDANFAECKYDKIYPFLIGNTLDVNATAMTLDPYGNILFAGWGRRLPYGWTYEYPPAPPAAPPQHPYSTANVEQGYVALIDKRGMPLWAFRIKDEFRFSATAPVIPENTYCTFVRHMKLSDNIDYAFVGCNGWRTDLNS